ncbi:DUF3622 domain-containing protein [Psychrobium sp. 1_MG-2023]|uniref:DUF3622 domain-containing protein n=1 Tax=Psychrobium sp. 1_MG-2023 TaxID=3062624 RepID=UPI000C346180|nr:DUF3622 domain-containing protein [Psychrobium sp. 1_MG-2023]MDP2559778.1 DUF3622 domain-containing protein [Psychrobium sp. 1_MG-2023]PKF59114.1 DUF3622 domain-containing protein [Alteromonadales bacterium alter-6D02]
MSNSKKFDINLIEDNGSWTAQITRRKTAKQTIVSKSQDGFASESDAQSWAEEQLKEFLQTIAARNKRR